MENARQTLDHLKTNVQLNYHLQIDLKSLYKKYGSN